MLVQSRTLVIIDYFHSNAVLVTVFGELVPVQIGTVQLNSINLLTTDKNLSSEIRFLFIFYEIQNLKHLNA